MDWRCKFILIILVIFCFLVGCKKDTKTVAVDPLEGKTFQITIVMDTIDDWSTGVKDGFIQALDQALNERGSKAFYSIEDTTLDPEKAAKIKENIVSSKPDLICTLVYPNGFANVQIAQKLKDPQYRFVSLDPVAVSTGTIDTNEKPGGNITGVGVFIQMNSLLKLANKIDPTLNNLVFHTWDKMPELNAWFKQELERDCQEEGWTLDFRLIPDSESEFELLSNYQEKKKGTLLMGGISAFVNRAGQPVDLQITLPEYYNKNVHTIYAVYEDILVANGYPFGTVVSWNDLGIQIAQKALLVLGGKNPGNIPWDYPRKYDIMLNLSGLRRLGYEPSQELITAASRVYTDYSGHYAGQK
jgi:putative ABC transport system substrate-binding protein